MTGTNTYKLDDKKYDIAKIQPEGQKAFALLAQAERDFLEINDRLSIAKAATIALHQKLQEYLTDDALVTDTDEE